MLCVFLDHAKAFDTVSHTQILDDLEDAGIRGRPFNLFNNYLTNSYQVVNKNNFLSGNKTLNLV